MPASSFAAARTRRFAKKISIDLASHTVQVTSEAKASPTSTAFTTGSALRNMPQGLRSRGSVAVPMMLSCAHAGKAPASQTSSAAALTLPHIPRGARTRLLRSSICNRPHPPSPGSTQHIVTM